MRRWRSFAAALLLPAAGAAGCAPGGGSGRETKPGSGTPPVAVEAARARAQELAQGIDVVGVLAPRFDAEVKSEYGGTVTDVYVTEWVRVKKGTPLARVDTREGDAVARRARASIEMAKAAVVEAEAAARRADREYERAGSLKESGLLTRQAYDDALTQKDAAAARVAAARAQAAAAEEDLRQAETRVSKSVIRAPFDGEVAGRFVNPGEVVGEMQKVVFRVVDNRRLELTAKVPSTEMAAVKVGQKLVFAADAFPGKTFSGTVRFINPAVDAADRSVRVVAEVPNDGGPLKGGLFVKGRIETGRRPGVLLVPRASLLSWDVQGKTADVFVVQDNVARKRSIRTGAVAGDRVEAASGLSAGEAVLTRGAFNVKDGDRVSVVRVEGEG